MSNPLKGSVCDAVATVHLTQIVQGKVTKVDFCEACAAKGGAGDAAVFKLADAVNAAMPAPAITCPQCGFTDVEFRRRGRLGCPSCWQVFGVALGLAVIGFLDDLKGLSAGFRFLVEIVAGIVLWEFCKKYI